MVHETRVPEPADSSAKVALLDALNGATNSRSRSIRSGVDAVISIDPLPAFRFPDHS